MATFLSNLWHSIFTPGPTPTLIRATNVSLASLQLVFSGLLIATRSLHFVVLSLLNAALWTTVNWFVKELELSKSSSSSRQQPLSQRETKRKRKHDSIDDSSDTEVEYSSPVVAFTSAQDVQRVTTTTSSSSADVDKDYDDLRQRSHPHQLNPQHHPTSLDGTQSSVSTEDEWEKISGTNSERSQRSS
ncbi:hypothetical protein CP533_5873 [Ophiocordyceps camponoti-saundersi (nom. inval.)]|nr:hypothetical protein CP533_5873 [Ophiocordyceps camponoti-saundersi (nom. inval.)]